MKILMIGGNAFSLVNFRGPLLSELKARGHEVVACAGEPLQDVSNALGDLGISFIPLSLARASILPMDDVKTLLHLIRIFRQVKPDVVITYTIKPVIWGGIAASFFKHIKAVSLITGLGHAFGDHLSVKGRFTNVVAAFLYKRALSKSSVVFFQNPDDMRLFVDRRLVQKEQAVHVNGTGVDLNYYQVKPLHSPPSFLMACRLLADKGVREYAAAAKAIKNESHDVAFKLAGATDPNPSSITKEELDGWVSDKVLSYHGSLNDVRSAYADSDVFVLPSYYREGVPRAIMEAMAMGRPIITTDAPGCRETVRLTDKGRRQQKEGRFLMEGINGFLIRPRDADALTAAMKYFINTPSSVSEMGKRSRAIAEEIFDVRKINAVMLEAMKL